MTANKIRMSGILQGAVRNARKAAQSRAVKRAAAFLTAAALSVQPFSEAMLSDSAFSALADLFSFTACADTFTGTVKATSLHVRSGPGTGYSSVATLANNASVTVTGETTGSDGKVWYSVFLSDGMTGYVRSDFIKRQTVYSASDSSFEAWLTQQGFPESYKNELRGLHETYPNWIFTAEQTGLDWNTVIAEESKVGRNLVYKTSLSSWKSTAQGAFDWAANYWPGFDGESWQAASSEIISYYMDPRNFLSEPYIFQFELQSYNASSQTKEGLEKIVAGTFLAGDALVPVEGSQIEGGTIVEVPVGTSGTAAQTSESTSAGPSSVTSDTQSGSIISGSGPSGGAVSGYVSSGPGAAAASSVTGSISAGPMAAVFTNGLRKSLSKGLRGLSAALSSRISDGLSGLFGMQSFAAGWIQDTSGWWYQNDDGTYRTGWNWIDGNNDGIAECYYFYDNGYMAANTEIDGYPINADGQWIHHDGTVYTQAASEQSGTGSGIQTVQMKKVPYVDILMKAAETSGVSPYVLASMIIQEQGASGTSDLISGTNASYPGYYNFYNLGAYEHDGMTAVEAGLEYASQSGNGDRPWNSIEKAIIGGASAYGANYVQNGQDTFYLKKFNVQGSNLYNHQYMTNVPAAANEGAKVSDAYSSDVKATSLVFKIPVYENMPAEPVTMPTGDGNPNNKLSNISVEGAVLSPSFSMDTQTYEVTVTSDTPVAVISAQTIDQNATVSGTGTISLSAGLNTVTLTVTAENGSVRDYTLQISYNGSETGALPGETASGGVISGTEQTAPVLTPGGTITNEPSTGPGGSDVLIIS